ncbi:MAG: TetR/AcrR family transcriptional regulator C-terminal domain-containing protein [Propioniciclava sp.]|uniref:TetR/AcrR family transcriptional regulator C-terminal domain-containing protein n=1 Tax=Propioniciclava sp. TaxID=2038686 RepID=UPI0039E65F57
MSTRRRLDRASVLRAAVAFADAHGLDSLTMRALADTLGVVPMALYKHVSDKDDLIGGMVDLVITDYPEPPAGRGWRDRVRSRVMTARAALGAHAWLRAAIGARRRRTETVLAHMNAVAGDFIEDGFSADLTHYAMHALGTRIWGYSEEAFDEEASAPPGSTDAVDASAEVVRAMAARFPHIVAIATDAAARNPAGCDIHDEFEFTLDLLLDAIERLHASEWVSRPHR